jgi:hypothetical protein
MPGERATKETDRQMRIAPDTSPEAAIKLAYDYARTMRRTGAADSDLEADVLELVETPYRESPVLRYLRAGFIAGYRGTSLPWVREIDALDPFTRASQDPGLASAPR